MVDQEKVKLMTKLAMYENNEGKEDLKIAEYFRSDYKGYFNLGSLIWISFAYGAVLILAMIMFGDKFLTDDISASYIMMIGLIVIIGYLGFLIIYLVICGHVAGAKYDDAEDRLQDYRKDLEHLLNYYKKQKRRRRR